MPAVEVVGDHPRSLRGAAKGGHFAAWEEPAVFADEVRAAFRSLRQT
ncbi:MAG TPA: hypothetical protein VI318_13710 [Baekduia sp.]